MRTATRPRPTSNGMKAIIIQARMGSTRLPGKVLKPLSGQPVLFHVIDRCRQARRADSVSVATTDKSEDDTIEALCAKWNTPCFRRSSEDVLSRFYHTAQNLHAKSIVRITADCPLIAPELIDECMTVFERSGADYASNTGEPRRLIRGLDVEVFSFQALSLAHTKATALSDREHVTAYIRRNISREFKIVPVFAAEIYTGTFRLTVDYPEDLILMEKLYAALAPRGAFIETRDAIAFLLSHPDIAAINRDCVQSR